MNRELPPTAGHSFAWSDFLLSSPVSLEAKLSSFLQVPYVQIESSGTAALTIALEALKRLSSRQTVIVPAYTCPLVALAVKKAGLRLGVCDVSKDGVDFDFSRLESMSGIDTLCIIPTHIGGLSADVQRTRAIAESIGAFVVEDAAQALGSSLGNKRLGTTGDIGIFSLARGKGLTIGEGGFVVAGSEEICQTLRAVGDDLRKPPSVLRETALCVQLLKNYLFCDPGGIARIANEMHCVIELECDRESLSAETAPPEITLAAVSNYRKLVGAGALDRLPDALAANASRARPRVARLAELPGVRVLMERDGEHGSWPFLFLIMPGEEKAMSALEQLSTTKLGVTQLFAVALPDYRYLDYPVPATCTPNAFDVAARAVTITNSHMLTDGDFSRICEILAEIVAG